MASDNETIYQAVGQGNLQAVEDWLAAGGDVNLASDSGWSLLHVAAHKGMPDMSRILIEAGADVHAPTAYHDGELPIHFAATSGSVGTTLLLLAAGADINARAKTGDTALVDAAYKGHLACVKSLVEAGADVRIAGTRHRQALHWAVSHGDVEMATLLVEAGANINAPDQSSDFDFRAIHIAAFGRHAGMIRWLADRGADVDSIDRKGMTALFHAVMDDDAEDVIRSLVKAGAKPEAVILGGESPMTVARGAARTALLAAIAEKDAGVLSEEAGKAPAANAARRRI